MSRELKPCPFYGQNVNISHELTISHPTDEHIFIQHFTEGCFISGIVATIKNLNRRVK